MDYIINGFINIFALSTRFIFYISPFLPLVFIIFLLNKNKDMACRISFKIMVISFIFGIVFSILGSILFIFSMPRHGGSGLFLLLPIGAGMIIILCGWIIAIIVWIILKCLTLKK
ncbi:hypothetical protein EZH24_08545 [Brachyspira catarrhinii]|uniref:DUF4870 domain-containing protein n=1 Tax=Brachyspira catarrhinii TaxID=2528966 RepID=A0ABY2TPQ8_9SPIR|nr:hypothetical protein EZH24_08545 [Brachyspira catarrhinii]